MKQITKGSFLQRNHGDCAFSWVGTVRGVMASGIIRLALIMFLSLLLVSSFQVNRANAQEGAIEFNIQAAATGIITATTEDGSFMAPYAVSGKQFATGVELDKHEATIVGAKTLALKATVAPDNATNKNVTWKSSNESAATVDADGIVSAVGKGEATITVTTNDGNFTDACKITVSNPITKLGLTQTSLTMEKGSIASTVGVTSGELAGSVDPPNGLNWSSTDESVATIVSVTGHVGGITAISSGSATIRLTLKVGEASLSAACAVKVINPVNPVKSVTISHTAKAVTVGDDSFTLLASVNPADADDTKIIWTSSNPAIATVDSAGSVKVLAAGSATIAASAGGKSATCEVVVSAKKISSTSEGSGFVASVDAVDSATAKTLDKYATEGLNLVAQAIESFTEPAKKAIDALTAAGGKIADSFDIHFANNSGDTITIDKDDQGNLKMTVKLKLTDSMRELDLATLKVYYIGENGTSEEKKTWIEGDYLCFETNHFSDYVVAGELPKQPAGGGGTASDSKPTATPTTLPSKGGSSLAPTGDPLAHVVTTAGVLSVVAALLLVASRKKRRSE